MFEGHGLYLADQVLEVAPEVALVSYAWVNIGEFNYDPAKTLDIPLDHTGDQVDKLLRCFLVEMARHPAIDKAEAPAFEHENVARMRVRVEEAVFEDLFDDDVDRRLRDVLRARARLDGVVDA